MKIRSSHLALRFYIHDGWSRKILDPCEIWDIRGERSDARRNDERRINYKYKTTGERSF